MTAAVVVRRVAASEWPLVRELRIEALHDPAAAVAFLGSAANAGRQPDAFWQRRTREAAGGPATAQFLAANLAGDVVGTATVLRRAAGEVDHLDRVLDADRADVVGVYVRPVARGSGAIDALLDACADWARQCGDAGLTLDVHVDNARARRAYERCGFADTGARMTGPIGAELEMRRTL
ncbi:MAG: GNAT family N-acetyltransferase [Microbacterium sp.]